jgi:hypothetical protein
MQTKKSPFALIFTVLTAALALFGVFREDFSEELPQSFAAYRPLPNYDRCTFFVEVSGEAWLACTNTSKPHPDSLPAGVPNTFPPYQGVSPVPKTIKPQRLELPRKMSDAEILARVKNPYKEYCVISEWASYSIRPLSPPDCTQTAVDQQKTKSRE